MNCNSHLLRSLYFYVVSNVRLLRWRTICLKLRTHGRLLDAFIDDDDVDADVIVADRCSALLIVVSIVSVRATT